VLFHPGEVLVVQGEPAKAFFVLRDGRVSLQYSADEGVTQHGADERGIEVATLAQDEYFGERSLLFRDEPCKVIVCTASNLGFVQAKRDRSGRPASALHTRQS
jgi:CRP-like cAMP-binding protein